MNIRMYLTSHHTMAFMKILTILIAFGLLDSGHDALAQTLVHATVTNKKDLTSQLQLGVSHTKPGLLYDLSPEEKLDPSAVARAKELVSEASTYQNTHIMGWELGNPNPTPGKYDWGGIDARMKLLGPSDVPVITLCAAPDWMKVADFPFENPDSYYPEGNQTNWDLIEKAPLPEYYDDFAHLAAEVARRYPRVKHFQVWNELKGFWSKDLNNWDYIEYTKLYNAVYDSLKAVSTDIRVGGGYLVIQGTGSALFNKQGRDTHIPISNKDREVLAYWLREKRGADFICVDRGVIDYHDPNEYTWEEKISLMYLWEKVGREVQDLVNASDTPNLPVWWSEYYGDSGEGGGQNLAAAYATLYYYMIRGGAATALLWNPMEGEVPHYLFTKATAGGAQPTPHYTVFKAIHDHFSAGTDILKTTTNDPAVSILASSDKTMLINAKQEKVVLRLNGKNYPLDAFEVKLIDTPVPPESQPAEPVAVSATSYQTPNVPENTLDGDLTTRWSAQGKGEAIVYDLSESTGLTTLRVHFLYGDRRQAYFQLAVSEDSTVWIPVYDGASSGTTDGFEAFELPPATRGRYLKLIGQGNTKNNWTSIKEVKIIREPKSDILLDAWEGKAPATVQVYPNPASAQVHVVLPSGHLGSTLTVYDAQGNRIGGEQLFSPEQRRMTIDTRTWMPGTYYLRIIGTDFTRTERVVKPND